MAVSRGGLVGGRFRLRLGWGRGGPIRFWIPARSRECPGCGSRIRRDFESQLGLAQGDDVVRLQSVCRHLLPVDQRAPGAVQILERRPAAGDFNLTMVAGNPAIVEPDVAILASS